MRQFTSFASVLFLLTAAASAAEPAYTIKLDRPLKAGEFYEERFTVDSYTKTITREVPAADPKTREVVLKGDAAGRVEIVEVDKGGNPVLMNFLVRKFVTGSDNKEAIPGGKTLEIRRTDAEVKITLKNGGEIPDDARQVIATCLGPLKRSNGMSDDTVQGTPRPRRVGDSWKAKGDGEVPAGIEMDPKNFTSQMLFKSIDTLNNVQAMRLVWTIQMKDFKVQLLPDYILDRSSSKTEVTSVVPVDAALPQIERSSLTQMEFAAHHSTGGATVLITQRISTRQTMTRVNP
jgi:hypothetical protein